MERGELMFAAAADAGQVFAALSERYRVQAEPVQTGRWTCLDTADWRLHSAGMTLRDAWHGRSAQLLLTSGETGSLSAPSAVHRWPRRVDALPESPVRERIAPAAGVRALLPLAEVQVRTLGLRLLDRDDKTRVRVRVDQPRLSGVSRTPLPLRVVVSPLRGYERDAERCTSLLTASMATLPAGMTVATLAMTAAGHVPGQPVVAPLLLDAHAPAAESVAAVLRRWMDVVDAARDGVVHDIDIEFLHDMRTAVRATRSMLKSAREVLPEQTRTRFDADFAWLGELTGPVRDLDVSLLELDGRGATDLTGLDGLEPLRRHLAARRRTALRALKLALESERSRRLSSNWRITLDIAARPGVTGPTTRDLVARQTKLAYDRIVAAAKPVDAATPADELHRLRRRCKRMRYLLDSYSSIYVAGPHKKVLTALKQLQNCLGEIQDVDVQRSQLAESAATLARRGTGTDTVLAMGALRERVLLRDAAAREVLAVRLAEFCSAKTRAKVDALAAAPA